VQTRLVQCKDMTQLW